MCVGGGCSQLYCVFKCFNDCKLSRSPGSQRAYKCDKFLLYLTQKPWEWILVFCVVFKRWEPSTIPGAHFCSQLSNRQAGDAALAGGVSPAWSGPLLPPGLAAMRGGATAPFPANAHRCLLSLPGAAPGQTAAEPCGPAASPAPRGFERGLGLPRQLVAGSSAGCA